MRIHVFFGLCLLAIAVSPTYGDTPKPVPSTVAPSTIAPSVVPTTPSSLTPCPGKCGGLIGLLQQAVYLANNIFANVRVIVSADAKNGAGKSVIPVLCRLLEQARDLSISLLRGAKLTQSQVAVKQAQGEKLVNDIKALLDSLLGKNTGTKYACTKPNGLLGGLLERIIDLLRLVLNDNWAHDRPLMAGLLSQIVVTVNLTLSRLQ